MDERAPLLGDSGPTAAATAVTAAVPEPQPAPQQRRSFWNKKILVGTAIAIIAGILALVIILGFNPHGNGNTVRYPGENIDWEPCGDGEDYQLECSSLHVPMDQFNKDNSGNKTFYIPLIRLRGSSGGGKKTATKNILFNPGGPGGSGVEFLRSRGASIAKIVGPDFHIVSFDPRGVKGSRPQAICYPDNASREAHTQPGVDPQQPGYYYTWAGTMARSCAETAGEHGQYINTPQTAADMNSILDAIGQKTLYYWGFSYGTVLGQTYATMYPERSERVAIDGVSNQFAWYGKSALLTEAFTDSDKVVSGFFRECIRAGPKCALSEFGHDAKSLEQNITSFVRSLKEDPFPVYVNNTHFGTISYSNLWEGGFFTALYNPSRWHSLANMMAKLLKGDGEEALDSLVPNPATTTKSDDDSIDESHEFIMANDAYSGPQFWPQTRKGLINKIMPLIANGSSFMEGIIDMSLLPAQWTVPHTHNFSPKRNVKTLHPLLVLSTTLDPICPLKSAKVARDSFLGARLIEVEGYGHSSLADPSLCAANYVRAFFVNGTMPENEDVTKCASDRDIYFENPEEEKEKLIKAQGGFGKERSTEEQQLLAALYDLADALEVPRWTSRRMRI